MAIIFRRKAKEFLTDREFVFSASMDLRWYNYTDAQKFLELALQQGHLRREGKTITPSFEYRKMELPPSFKPSPELLKSAPAPKAAPAQPGAPAKILAQEPLFIRIVDEISRKLKQERATVIAKVNKKRETFNLDAEVLVLLVAREAGIDIAGFLDDAEKTVRERALKRMEEEDRDTKPDEEE